MQVAGFDATYISYDTAYSYSTVSGWGGPWYGRRSWHGGGFGTAVSTTTSYIPRAERTSAYRNRAVDVLEQAGFLLKTSDPQYQIEVTLFIQALEERLREHRRPTVAAHIRLADLHAAHGRL